MSHIRLSRFFHETAKRKLSISLVFRVVLILFAFLLLPLFLHSLFLYKQEYLERKADMLDSFKIYTAGKGDDLSLQLKSKRELLFAISRGEIKSLSFKEIKKSSGVKEIFYISYDRPQSAICLASSSDELIGKQFKEGPYSGAVQEDFSFFMDKERPGLVFARQALNLAEGKGAFFLAFKIDFENSSSFFHSTLFLPEGQIAASSETSFLGSNVSFDGGGLRLSKSDVEGLYNFEFQSAEGFAFIKKIGGPFSLLTTFDESHIKFLHWRSYLSRMAILSLELALAAILVGWMILAMTRPLKNLSGIMARVAKGDLRCRYAKQKFGFEINALGSFFNQMLDAIAEHQKEIEIHRLEKQRLIQEFRIGHHIQRSILSEPLKVKEVDIAPGYLPAKEVGGDFYDLFPCSDDKLLLTIADAAGKGISACLYSLSFRSMLRSFALASSDLGSLVSKANDLFILDAKDSGMFVTAWVAIYDKKSRLLRYCSLGHPFAMLKRKGKLIELGSENMAIGVEKFSGIDIKETVLEAGDLLLLYTDGVIEAENHEGEFYGKERLKTFLKGNFPSAKTMVFALLDDVKKFSKATPQTDDITLLVFKVV